MYLSQALRDRIPSTLRKNVQMPKLGRNTCMPRVEVIPPRGVWLLLSFWSISITKSRGISCLEVSKNLGASYIFLDGEAGKVGRLGHPCEASDTGEHTYLQVASSGGNLESLWNSTSSSVQVSAQSHWDLKVSTQWKQHISHKCPLRTCALVHDLATRATKLPLLVFWCL